MTCLRGHRGKAEIWFQPIHKAAQIGLLVVNSPPRPLYVRGTDPVPIAQDTGWFWTRTENLPPPGSSPCTVQPVAVASG